MPKKERKRNSIKCSNKITKSRKTKNWGNKENNNMININPNI